MRHLFSNAVATATILITMEKHPKKRIPVRPQSALESYQHMSAHYRRILNVKPSVDTSTPKSFMKTHVKNKSQRKWSLTEFTKTKENLPASKNESLNFQPKTLKTEVTSKLRELHVYYPPRKKIPGSTKNMEKERNNLEKIISIDIGSSSRDSAYSGGVSSAVETQNPTFQRTSLKNSSTQTDEIANDDELYTKFIYDVTKDLVDNSLFTNRSISKVMKFHYTKNHQLNKTLMCEQLLNLAKKLDIPPEDEHISWLMMQKDGFDIKEKKMRIIQDTTEVEPKKELNRTFVVEETNSEVESKKLTMIETNDDDTDESFEESVASSGSDLESG